MEEHMKQQLIDGYLDENILIGFNDRSEEPLFKGKYKGKIVTCFEFHTRMIKHNIAFFVDDELYFEENNLKKLNDRFYYILQDINNYSSSNVFNIKHQFISRRWSKIIQKELNKRNNLEKEIK